VPPPDGDAAAGLTEADQLGVVARAWREALRADVQRLEQVRLADAVRPDRKNEPRLQLQLEPFIRAKVAQRDAGDDQA